MAIAAVLAACCDVIAPQDGQRRCLLHFVFRDVIVILLASGFQLSRNITRGEEFLDRPETLSSARVTSLTGLEQVLPESDELHILVILARDGGGISSTCPCFRTYSGSSLL